MSDTKTNETASTANVFYNDSHTNLQNVVLDIANKAKTVDHPHTAALLLNSGRPYSIISPAAHKQLVDASKDALHEEHAEALQILDDQSFIIAETFLKQKYKRAKGLTQKYKLNNKSKNDSMVLRLNAIASTHYDNLRNDQRPRTIGTVTVDAEGKTATQGAIVPFADTTWQLRLTYIETAVANAASFIKNELLKRLTSVDRDAVSHLDGWGVFQELHEWRQLSQLGVLTETINDALSNNTGSSTADCRSLQSKLANLARDLPVLNEMTALQIIQLLGVDNILKHTLQRDPNSASVVYGFYDLPIDNVDITNVISKLKSVQKTTAWVGNGSPSALLTNTGGGGGTINNANDNSRQHNQQQRGNYNDTRPKVANDVVARVAEVYQRTLRTIAERDKGNLPTMSAAHHEAAHARGSISSVMRPMDARRYFKSKIFHRQWSQDLQRLPWKIDTTADTRSNRSSKANVATADATAMAASVQDLEHKYEALNTANKSLISTNEHLIAALQTAGLIDKQ